VEGKVLVAYGSKYGATAGIAQRIGKVLDQEGIETDVRSADEVGDVSQYEAFVVGSAAYYGKWRKEAVRLVKKHESSLAGKDTWIFTSGPTGEGDPLELSDGWRAPKALEEHFARINPHDTALFGGKVDPDKLGPIERQALKTVKAPSGDFRDWEAITSWAATIATTLKNA
jgi:menaquinone-dependent protoporphyrinogen oxidase